MSWAEFHAQSERLAAEAEVALRSGDTERAVQLYVEAADAETRALETLDRSKARTIGISSVSAVSLWYKARNHVRAEQTAYRWLSSGLLPEFADEQLKNLLQTIWSDRVREEIGVRFAPGEVLVSVKGGEIVAGGAPLDLIVRKVEGVQSLFYRTAEFLSRMPHRKRGSASLEIQEICRPWLFQTAPGSYQFAVAVQEPRQQDLFPKSAPKSAEIADAFLKILRASVEDPDEALAEIVPDRDYRGTFLKLTRNLAPTGKTFEEMEIRSLTEPRPITLLPSARSNIGQALRRQAPPRQVTPEFQEETIRGVLRGVHLDQDWLEVSFENQHIRVMEVGETVDDVIGPMVNRPVIVETVKDRRGRYLLRDIQADE